MNDEWSEKTSVSVWAGSFQQTSDLPRHLQILYVYVGFNETDLEPRVAAEKELTDISDLLESLPFASDFAARAGGTANAQGLSRATAVVAIYLAADRKLRLPPPKSVEFIFLGTFPISQACITDSSEGENGDAIASAIEKEDWVRVESLLNMGYSIDIQDADGESALYQACRLREIAKVEALIKLGADTEIPNAVGITPLMVACALENPEMVKILLAAGVSVSNSTGENEYTALFWALLHRPRDVQKVLFIVSQLLKAGADVNLRANDGTTPLMHAAWFGSAEVVSALIAAGADTAAVDEKGSSAFSMASERDNRQAYAVLKNSGSGDLKSGSIYLKNLK